MREEKAKNSTAYAPVFSIVGWIPRPPDLPADGIAPATRIAKAPADPKQDVNYYARADVFDAPLDLDTIPSFGTNK